MDFKNIDYLKYGSNIQQLAYRELSDLKIFLVLQEFQPVLTVTIPLDIAITSNKNCLSIIKSNSNLVVEQHQDSGTRPAFAVSKAKISKSKSLDKTFG